MDKPAQQSNGGQILAAVLIGTIGSGLLFSASLAVPLIGFVSAFLAPVSLGLTRIKGGRGAAVFSVLLTTLLMAIAFTPPIAAWYIIQCGMIGLILPELALKGLSPSRSILWTTAATVTLTGLLVTVYAISNNVNPQLFAQKEIADGMSQTIKLYEQQSGLSTQDLEIFRHGMQQVGQFMTRTYPALATINLGIISSICLLFFRQMALRWSLETNQAAFKEFMAPALLIWLLIAAGFAMLAPTTLITTPALNILAILAVVYFAQGLAVLLTFCERTSFSSTMKIALTILLVTQPYLNAVIAVIGIFDYWGEFRTPRTKQEENL